MNSQVGHGHRRTRTGQQRKLCSCQSGLSFNEQAIAQNENARQLKREGGAAPDSLKRSSQMDRSESLLVPYLVSRHLERVGKLEIGVPPPKRGAIGLDVEPPTRITDNCGKESQKRMIDIPFRSEKEACARRPMQALSQY